MVLGVASSEVDQLQLQLQQIERDTSHSATVLQNRIQDLISGYRDLNKFASMAPTGIVVSQLANSQKLDQILKKTKNSIDDISLDSDLEQKHHLLRLLGDRKKIIERELHPMTECRTKSKLAREKVSAAKSVARAPIVKIGRNNNKPSPSRKECGPDIPLKNFKKGTWGSIPVKTAAKPSRKVPVEYENMCSNKQAGHHKRTRSRTKIKEKDTRSSSCVTSWTVNDSSHSSDNIHITLAPTLSSIGPQIESEHRTMPSFCFGIDRTMTRLNMDLIRRLFHDLDADRDGKLDIQDFQRGARLLGLSIPAKLVTQYFQLRCQRSTKNLIGLQEFTLFMKAALGTSDKAKHYSDDRSGTISNKISQGKQEPTEIIPPEAPVDLNEEHLFSENVAYTEEQNTFQGNIGEVVEAPTEKNEIIIDQATRWLSHHVLAELVTQMGKDDHAVVIPKASTLSEGTESPRHEIAEWFKQNNKSFDEKLISVISVQLIASEIENTDFTGLEHARDKLVSKRNSRSFKIEVDRVYDQLLHNLIISLFSKDLNTLSSGSDIDADTALCQDSVLKVVPNEYVEDIRTISDKLLVQDQFVQTMESLPKVTVDEPQDCENDDSVARGAENKTSTGIDIVERVGLAQLLLSNSAGKVSTEFITERGIITKARSMRNLSCAYIPPASFPKESKEPVPSPLKFAANLHLESTEMTPYTWALSAYSPDNCTDSSEVELFTFDHYARRYPFKKENSMVSSRYSASEGELPSDP